MTRAILIALALAVYIAGLIVYVKLNNESMAQCLETHSSDYCEGGV